MKEIWRNLDGPPENKELWSYVVKFEFSRPKSSIGEHLYRTANISRPLQIENLVCREVRPQRVDNGILVVQLEVTCGYDC